MRVAIYLTILLFFSACADLDEHATSQSTYDKLDLYTDHSPQAAYYMKKHLITYFKDVALGAEFGDKAPVSKKWISEMKVFVHGEDTEQLLDELDVIIQEVNQYATDGFKVSLAESFEDANFQIYFTSSSEYADQYPYLLGLIKENKGLFTTFHDEDFNIYKGHMYVDSQRTVLEEQLHLLREEFTQALGLANDIPYYFDSIFYQGESRTTNYSENDINVIKLLYHPAIISGLGDDSIQNVLEDLLGV